MTSEDAGRLVVIVLRRNLPCAVAQLRVRRMSFGHSRFELCPCARRDDTCRRSPSAQYETEDGIDYGNDIGATVRSSELHTSYNE